MGRFVSSSFPFKIMIFSVLNDATGVSHRDSIECNDTHSNLIADYTKSRTPDPEASRQDARLETNRSDEGEPCRSEWNEAKPSGTSGESGPLLLSGLRRGQHKRTFASDWDASKDLNAFKKVVTFESSGEFLSRDDPLRNESGRAFRAGLSDEKPVVGQGDSPQEFLVRIPE
jgi:hypothetical protein